MIVNVFNGFWRILNLFFVRRAWRKLNTHNDTIMVDEFPLNLVTVGEHSYGNLRVRSFCPQAGEKLLIGNYVSIADNVFFLLGGNHQMKGITTFPLKSRFNNIQDPSDARSKGPIVIEDDVWIGFGSTILSGVCIGKGAIVAAGSVVSVDVPPYSIVGGTPAKIIKYRFEHDIIEKLKGFNLTDFSKTQILEHIDLFYLTDKITFDMLDSIVKDLNKINIKRNVTK